VERLVAGQRHVERLDEPLLIARSRPATRTSVSSTTFDIRTPYLVDGRKVCAGGQSISLIHPSVILDCLCISFVQRHGAVTGIASEKLS
jgi:hypothetical protein